MFKDLANMASLMKNAQQMGSRMQEMQEKLADLHAEGTAGGGMVTVKVNGQQQLITCTIDPSLLESPDKEMIEELVVAATNQALQKAKLLVAQQFQDLTGGMSIPGLSDLMGKFNA